jgi:formylglycine-generating enzyme required for sulfatase activity
LDIEMVFVKGGTFTKACEGTNSGCSAKCSNTVTLTSFSIGKYEITRAQWKAIMKGHPTLALGNSATEDQQPMMTNWYNVDTAFLPRLNALTGRTTAATKYRLPTEAEWVYAASGCRGDGGTGVATCDNFTYSGSDDLNEVGWYSVNAGGGLHPVGQKKPNGLGIYDMSGNSWEWTMNLYVAFPCKDSPVIDPSSYAPPSNTYYRVIHSGGHTITDTRWFAVTTRNSIEPTNGGVGIRVVLPAQ